MGLIAFTIALVIITVLLSIAAFNDNRLSERLILWPARMHRAKEYYRLLTAGFIHADWMHLIFNMLALFTFGQSVEYVFMRVGLTPWLYVFMYLSGIVVASLPSFFKQRDNGYYRALGASGGVSAVIFSYVYFAPWQDIYLFGFGVKSVVFAVLYLIYSAYMSRRGDSHIGHDAHFWGAVWGFLFTLAVEPSHGQIFIQQLRNISFGN